MDGQRACIANIGRVIEEPECVDESHARIAAVLELEAHDTPKAAFQILVCALALLRIGLQAWIDDTHYFAVLLKMERNCPSITAVFAHPERKRLQALDELKGVEGTHAHAHIPQKHNSRANEISDWSQRLHGLRPYHAMIAGIRLVERGEPLFVCRPVEIAAVDNHTANRGSVPPDVFGGRVNDDSGAVIKRSAQERRSGVIHDQGYTERPPDCRNLSDREDGQLGIRKRFGVIRTSAIVSRPAEVLGVSWIGEAHIDAH